MRSLVPITGFTVMTVVVAATIPPQEVAIVTTTSGAETPAGKPDPVMLTCVWPAPPKLGAVATLSFTAGVPAAQDLGQPRIVTQKRATRGVSLLSDARSVPRRFTTRSVHRTAIQGRSRNKELGSGTALVPVVAWIIARSPSLSALPTPELDSIVALKSGRIESVELSK